MVQLTLRRSRGVELTYCSKVLATQRDAAPCCVLREAYFIQVIFH